MSHASRKSPIKPQRRDLLALAVLAAAFFVGSAPPPAAAGQQFADIVAVKVQPRSAGKFDFDVTVSSPYDSAQRYADAFRVMGKDGKVYGERTLLHDHATEQPFTRDLYGVSIPLAVKNVVVQARDQKYGYGGKTVEVTLPGR
ncbi:MAG: hypothetical protein ACYCZ6_03010 [Polaromonas sp.]